MLSMTRKEGETILINDDIRITINCIEGSQAVSLSIEAPKEITILRKEVHERNRVEDRLSECG